MIIPVKSPENRPLKFGCHNRKNTMGNQQASYKYSVPMLPFLWPVIITIITTISIIAIIITYVGGSTYSYHGPHYYLYALTTYLLGDHSGTLTARELYIT